MLAQNLAQYRVFQGLAYIVAGPLGARLHQAVGDRTTMLVASSSVFLGALTILGFAKETKGFLEDKALEETRKKRREYVSSVSDSSHGNCNGLRGSASQRAYAKKTPEEKEESWLNFKKKHQKDRPTEADSPSELLSQPATPFMEEDYSRQATQADWHDDDGYYDGEYSQP